MYLEIHGQTLEQWITIGRIIEKYYAKLLQKIYLMKINVFD